MMKVAYVSDKETLSGLVKNGGRLLSDNVESTGTHIYTVDVTKVLPTLFINGQIIRCFSCERPVLTF